MTSELKGYARFASEQPPYNLLDRRIENELIPMCERLGLGVITWAPMAMGVLAGRYLSDSDYPEGSRAALRGGFYADRVTRAGIAVGRRFAGIASLRTAESTALRHLEDLLPVLEMTLTDEQRAACDALVPPGSVVADFHNTAGWMKMKVIPPTASS